MRRLKRVGSALPFVVIIVALLSGPLTPGARSDGADRTLGFPANHRFRAASFHHVYTGQEITAAINIHDFTFRQENGRTIATMEIWYDVGCVRSSYRIIDDDFESQDSAYYWAITPVASTYAAGDNVKFAPLASHTFIMDPVPCGPVLAGDADHDGRLTVLDLVTLVGSLFTGDCELLCPEEADYNLDGETNIADLTALSTFLYPNSEPETPFQDPP